MIAGEEKCGHCGMAIHPSDSRRYFGFHGAHQEYRCMELLKARIAELEADKARLDWLENHNTPFEVVRLRESECGGDFKYIENDNGYFRGKTIRAAIDDAVNKVKS